MDDLSIAHVEFKLGGCLLKHGDFPLRHVIKIYKNHKFSEGTIASSSTKAENTMRFLFIVAFLDSQLMAFAVEATVLMQSRPGIAA